MSLPSKRIAKLGVLAVTILMIMPVVSSTMVKGIVDFDRPRTIDPGYNDAFTYTVENYKNQRFSVTVTFNETVDEDYVLNVFVTNRTQWDNILDNVNTTIAHLNMTHTLVYDESGTEVAQRATGYNLFDELND